MYDKLKQFFKNKKTVRQSSIDRFALQYQLQFQQLLKNYQQNYKHIFDFRVFIMLVVTERLNSFCKTCNRQLNYNQISNHAKYCSVKCSSNDPQLRQKFKLTCLQKYGCEFPSQNKQISQKTKQTNLQRYGFQCANSNPQIKKKRIQTNLQKYGCEYAIQNKEVKAKIIRTNLQKYGCQYGLQNQSVKEKRKITNLQKYGVQNVFQNDKIKEKSRSTMLSKYGVQYNMQSEQLRNKVKKTNLQKYGSQHQMKSDEFKNKFKNIILQKYGVQNVFQNDEIKEKIKQTNLQRYGVERTLQSKHFSKKVTRFNLDVGYENLLNNCNGIVQPLFTKQQYQGGQNKIVYKWKCLKCNNIFQQDIHSNDHLGYSSYIPRCLICYPILANISKPQKQIVQFVKNIYNGQIVENNRTIIKPYQLDIYIPQKNIAIQFDGLLWHSEKFSERFNLKNKTQLCKSKGITLIHVFQDQWINNKKHIQMIISNLLIDNVEKFNIEIKSNEEIKTFLDNFVLDAKHNNSINVIAKKDNNIIGLISLQLIKQNYYKITNICANYYMFNQLLNYIQNNYTVDKIVCQIDNRFLNESIFKQNKFNVVFQQTPQPWYTKQQTRFRCNENFQNYNVIFDCGKTVFVKTY